MEVFIGYGYNERDRWIEQYVFPLAVAFGCDVQHGKAVYGGPLSAEVIEKIRKSNAMIGFTTRRDELARGSWGTHSWVVQELVTAHGQNPPIPWVEVRESGVVSPGGILDNANLQRIDYQEENRAECLVKVAEALQRLQELTRITTVRLGPETAVENIIGLMDDASFTCECQRLRGSTTSPIQRIPVFPIKGGLFVSLSGVTPEELVRLKISARGRVWRSDFESVDTVDIRLKE